MTERQITAVDVIGNERIERKVVPTPIRRERPPPLDSFKTDRDFREYVTRTLERMQQAIDDATVPARSCPLFAEGGHLTEEISFTNGTEVVVEHGLGRPYKGAMLIVGKVAAAAGYLVDNDSNVTVRKELDKVQLKFHPTATFTGRLWIF